MSTTTKYIALLLPIRWMLLDVRVTHCILPSPVLPLIFSRYCNYSQYITILHVCH
jgi:hypothetical protein